MLVFVLLACVLSLAASQDVEDALLSTSFLEQSDLETLQQVDDEVPSKGCDTEIPENLLKPIRVREPKRDRNDDDVQGILLNGRSLEIGNAKVDADADGFSPSKGEFASWTVEYDGRSIPLLPGLPQTDAKSAKSAHLPLVGSVVNGWLRIGEDGYAVFENFNVQKSQRQALIESLCPRPKKIGFFLISFADPEACTAKSPVSGPRPKIHKNPGPVEECNPECSLDELRDAAYRNPEINVRDFYMRTTQGRVNFIVSEADVHEVTFPEDYKVDSMEAHKKFWDVIKSLPEFKPEWEQYEYRQFVVPENFRPFKFCCASGFANLLGADSFMRGCKRTRTMIHEIGHSLGLKHNGAWVVGKDGRPSFKGEADNAGLMGAQADKKEGNPNVERGTFTVGQLYQLGALPEDNYVEITEPGKYHINSVTSLKGVFAARIRLYDGERSFWLEWRQRRGLDKKLNKPSKKNVLHTQLFDTLLVRLHRGQRKETELVAILAPGDSLERSGVSIKHSKKVLGDFEVKFTKVSKKTRETEEREESERATKKDDKKKKKKKSKKD